MTNQEFSLEFDILYNNITSGQAPGINDYEKSVFLTKGQEEIMKNYLNPLGNKYQEGFDDSRKRFTDFASLIKTEVVPNSTIPISSIDKRSLTFPLPKDLLVAQNEVLESGNKEFQVIPISYLEYTRLMSRPYKEPKKGQVWRLTSEGNSEWFSIIIPHSSIKSGNCIIRYVKKPSPIILRDLKDIENEEGLPENFLSINGERLKSNCELNSEIHREILDRAIELAKVSYTDNVTPLTQINTRNE